MEIDVNGKPIKFGLEWIEVKDSKKNDTSLIVKIKLYVNKTTNDYEKEKIQEYLNKALKSLYKKQEN